MQPRAGRAGREARRAVTQGHGPGGRLGQHHKYGVGCAARLARGTGARSWREERLRAHREAQRLCCGGVTSGCTVGADAQGNSQGAARRVTGRRNSDRPDRHRWADIAACTQWPMRQVLHCSTGYYSRVALHRCSTPHRAARVILVELQLAWRARLQTWSLTCRMFQCRVECSPVRRWRGMIPFPIPVPRSPVFTNTILYFCPILPPPRSGRPSTSIDGAWMIGTYVIWQ